MVARVLLSQSRGRRLGHKVGDYFKGRDHLGHVQLDSVVSGPGRIGTQPARGNKDLNRSHDSSAQKDTRIPKAVVVLSLPHDFCETIVTDAERMGYRAYVANDLSQLESALAKVVPELALVNVDVSNGPETVALCRRKMVPASKIVALTDVPCLLRAGEVVRMGASMVLARPTTFLQIISALAGTPPRHDLTPMSLDRAIWEYLNQTLAETGSIAASARRLRLDRTSFKRMLRKRPPIS